MSPWRPSGSRDARFDLSNRSVLNLNISHRLTNQNAFDGAMLSLLNQGRSSVSASGHARYRGPRGKSAIGALIPDEMYLPSMEGKKVHHWLAARGSEYDALRERFGGVTPALLDELEDLHDRIGACMPSLYRQLAVAGAQRIAQSFKLSMRLVQRCAAYQYLRGPRIVCAARPPAIPAAAPPVLEVTPAPGPSAAPTPALGLTMTPPPAAGVTATPPPAPGPTTIPTEPAATATATPVQQPLQLKQPSQEDDLDLIARGIAKAIAAARGLDHPGS